MVIGGATKDAEERTTQSGKTVVKFSLGCGKRADDSSIYADCEAWNRVADLAKGIKKGDLVMAAGSIRPYTSQTGKTYNNLNCEIVVNASLMGVAGITQAAAKLQGNTPASVPTAATAPNTDFVEIGADDGLPF